MPSVFMTGAGGCVGHYLVDELAPHYDLFLLIRNPDKLLFDPRKYDHVHIIAGDLDAISDQAELLARMDYCVHVATAWGGEAAERINVKRSHELFNLLNPARVRRIIYFSTASILGRGNLVLPEAEKYGTEYIRTKYRCYAGLARCPLNDRIVTVFPTLIFGGDQNHPASHLSSGIRILRRYAWLLGRINVDVSFHYMHARDIARIVRKLLDQPQVRQGYVLGNEPTSLGKLLKHAAACFGHHIRWQIPISTKTLRAMASIAGSKLTAWDRFCLAYADFRYQTINAATMGLPIDLSTLDGILADWKTGLARDYPSDGKSASRDKRKNG